MNIYSRSQFYVSTKVTSLRRSIIFCGMIFVSPSLPPPVYKKIVWPHSSSNVEINYWQKKFPPDVWFFPPHQNRLFSPYNLRKCFPPHSLSIPRKTPPDIVFFPPPQNRLISPYNFRKCPPLHSLSIPRKKSPPPPIV